MLQWSELIIVFMQNIKTFTGICDACGKTPPSLAWKFPQLKKKQQGAKKQLPISEEEEEHKEKELRIKP